MVPDYTSTRIESVRLAKKVSYGLTREQVGPRRLAQFWHIFSSAINARALLCAEQLKEEELGNGVEVDRAGRVKVLPDLSLAGHPEISVVGELAAAMSHGRGKPPKHVPGVSPGAKQMGRAAAANLVRRLQGQPTKPFRYRDYGNLATMGRNSAVVDLTTPLGPVRFSGLFAWLF